MRRQTCAGGASPGFAEGDGVGGGCRRAAAADWLDVAEGMRVLDARRCAGGQNLPSAGARPRILTAAQNHAHRLQRVQKTLPVWA